MVDKELIRRYILTNAVEHNGKANAKSVLSSILGSHPEYRNSVMELKSIVEEETDKINGWGLEKQEEKLNEIGAVQKTVREEKKELPEMVGARRGNFVVRFAPNPNGPLHLGSARPAIINNEYAKKYDGKFILRFDDTDPANIKKLPKREFYKWIEEDLKWLGIKPDKVYKASQRLSTYYNYAKKVIEIGGAYVCTCEAEEWKKKKNEGRSCPCRSLTIKQNLERWKKVVSHKFKQGEATLKIKTDMEAKNPAVRDWTALRIIDKPMHPLVKGKFLWPMYNFQSAIDDHLLGVTHILRGQEHSTNEVKQQYLYQHLGWEYPVTVVMGRFSLSDTELSTSKTREKIENGKYHGWDDIRTGTLQALRRRGIQPEAIREMVLQIGNKPSDVTISMENLAAFNRRIIDKDANRYFFVPDPVKIVLDKTLKKSLTIPSHPDKPSGKKRKFKFTKEFFIDNSDFEKYNGLEIRLKDLFNVKLSKKSTATTVAVKNIPKIQWVPSNFVIVRIETPAGRIEGYAEKNITDEKEGSIIQFERFGFVKIEKKSAKNITCVFTHK